MTDKRMEFCKELLLLLEKYECHIEAKDHYEGYAECGQDVRMTIEFADYQVGDIDLGGSCYHDSYIDLSKKA